MSPEPVGSLAEEAAKLVAALSSIQPGARFGHDDAEHEGHDEHDEHDEHDALSAECRYCPLCALARAARSMTPEVREHLTSAASSLLLAARSILDEAVARAGADDADADKPVEKIDLAEE
jgi:hypothetical protein